MGKNVGNVECYSHKCEPIVATFGTYVARDIQFISLFQRRLVQQRSSIQRTYLNHTAQPCAISVSIHTAQNFPAIFNMGGAKSE